MNFLKIILGLGILAGAGGAVFLLELNRPKAQVTDIKKVLPAVEVMQVNSSDREMEVPSQGVVEARKTTQVAAEVAGRVVSVSEKFDKGGEFVEGEMVIKLDEADYKAAVAEAKASLVERKLLLETEQAKAAQAKRDWDNLGRAGAAKDLTLRKPQLASAEAKVEAAKAALKKAERDLARTEIKAPFAGRIRKINTELGAYLKPGNPVVEYYTTEPYELRMPISLDELQFVKNVKQGGNGAQVEIITAAGGELFTWKGEVIRNESEIERASRSIYLVALMEGRSEGEGVRLQPGLFVQARIEGGTLKDSFEVPMKAFVDLNHLLIVNDKSRLEIRQVRVVRREGAVAIIAEGLKNGERICMTALPDVIDGMEVRIVEEEKVKEDGNKQTTQSTQLP
ncbi:MAG: efflux RND transporter periplasmic adaptor subunit [Verrucomicrobiota bacterium]